MSDSDLTTDALPSPPRDEPKPSASVHNKSTKEKVSNESKGRRDSNERFEPKSQSVPNSGFFEKKSRVVNNVVQVINSTGIRIGNTTTLNHYYGPSKSQRDDQETITETEQMASLKKSTEPVSTNDIDAIKEHIGHNYRSIFVKLGLTIGEIDQAEMRFSKNESEKMRDLLLKWRQSNFKKDATVGKLAQALWDSHERAALKIWASQYDQLHRNK